MRFVEIKKYNRILRGIIYRRALLVAFPAMLLLWLFALITFSVDTFLIGVMVFVFVFGLMTIMSLNIYRAVNKKRSRTGFECLHLDVSFDGENGALCILEDKLVFHSLAPVSKVGDFETELNETTYIGTGLIEPTSLRKFLNRGLSEGHIIVKEKDQPFVRIFLFYNIDDSFDKVTKRVKEVSKFRGDIDEVFETQDTE